MPSPTLDRLVARAQAIQSKAEPLTDSSDPTARAQAKFARAWAQLAVQHAAIPRFLPTLVQDLDLAKDYLARARARASAPSPSPEPPRT